MRIVHVVTALDPAAGGPPIVVTRLAAAQAMLGHDVHVMCYRRPEADERTRVALEGIPGWNQVTTHVLDPATGLEGVFAKRAGSALADLAPTVDLMHGHSTWAPIVLGCAASARRVGLPYVICPHGMLDPWCLAQNTMKKKLALAVAYRRMLNGASFIHALNRDERDLMAPLGLTPPVEIIPNGIFIEEFESLPEPGAFHERRPELEGAPFILFLSRLHYKKGLDYLADAFARVATALPDVRLVVAGPDGGAQEPFERAVREAGVQDRVHVVGPIYGRDKLALVDAGCFCLPSRQEGFSIAITEALACALPVVISDACHFPEVAEVNAGEVVPLGAEETATALIRVMRDPSLRERMGEAGSRLVRERFTWPRIAERSIECYETHVGVAT